MSRLLALSGETVKVLCDNGDNRTFTITAFDPLEGKYVGLGHKSTADFFIGKVPQSTVTVHLDGTDSLCDLCSEGLGPHPLLGPIAVHNNFGVCGPLKRLPRQGLMWTAKAQEGMAYIISSAFLDLTAPSVDVPPVAIPIEITKVTNDRWHGGKSQFLYTGLHLKGMSGSPIIQNGCIIGAHYGANPSDNTGVGVHIDQMLTGLYWEANKKMKLTGNPRGPGSGRRGVRNTRNMVNRGAKQRTAASAKLNRLHKNALYIARLQADAPKFDQLRKQIAAYEAGKISKGILFEKQKRTYPEALKLLWDYDRARWKAALKTWDFPSSSVAGITKEQRIAIERCLLHEV